jgi:hypothetical protein
MKRFEELVSRCKCAVTLAAREHTVNYQTIAEYIDDILARGGADEIDEDTVKRAVAADVLYEVQFYDHTPVGFYRVYGATAEEAVERALAVLDRRRP